MKGTKASAKETKSSAKDPVCGMNVDKETAIHWEREGKHYYFCSEQCRQEFESSEAEGEPASR